MNFEITFRNIVTGAEIILDRMDNMTNYYFNNSDYEVVLF